MEAKPRKKRETPQEKLIRLTQIEEELWAQGRTIAGIDEETNRIGIAEIDEERCIAFQQRGCQVCVDACVYGAITLDAHGRPVVDADACNGCGRCEYLCPSASYLAYSGGRLRGINVKVQV